MGRLRGLTSRFERFRAPAVGLDIDRGAVKAVQVSGSEEDGYTLSHVGYRKLPPGAIFEGEVANHSMLASELKELWSTHSFRGKSVYLGIANQKVVVRLLDFPRMSPEDLNGAIRFEAQEHIPMPIDEAILDHMVLGSHSEDPDLDRILIVAAQKDMVARYASAARAAGLRPQGIDVKALSLTRSTLPDTLFDDEGATLLLDVASEISSLVVAQNGVPTLTRFIPGGSGYLAQAVADAADLPEEDAERQLMNPRVRIGPESQADEGSAGVDLGKGRAEDETDEFDAALMYDVRRGLEDAVQALAEDVQRSIEYHYSQPGSQEVAQAFVSGEGALVNGIDSYLGELLGISVRRGSPLQKLSGNKSNVGEAQLGVMEPVLAVAVGLSLEDA